MAPQIHCVLFDLDGTLADTAPDLVAPIQAMRLERGLVAMPFSELRPFASMGARGLIGKGLGVAKESAEFPALRDEFLTRYEENICVETRLFPGISSVLDQLDQERIAWGIVSNKVVRYVRLLAEALHLDTRSTCLVGGDSTPTPKPHPAPLLLGATLSKCSPKNCVYVGDDHRDIQAGQAAQMRTVAATYGYNGAEDPAHRWGADFVINTPLDFLPIIQHLRSSSSHRA
jgi:N-acetyl-D-muramate 6-phosphate phosphatase